MTRTPEKKVKDKVVGILKEQGVYYFFAAMNGMGRSGVPDIIACYKGCFIGIECKAGNNEPTLLQKHNMKQIIAQKGLAIVVNEGNIEELLAMLKELE